MLVELWEILYQQMWNIWKSRNVAEDLKFKEPGAIRSVETQFDKLNIKGWPAEGATGSSVMETRQANIVTPYPCLSQKGLQDP